MAPTIAKVKCLSHKSPNFISESCFPAGKVKVGPIVTRAEGSTRCPSCASALGRRHLARGPGCLELAQDGGLLPESGAHLATSGECETERLCSGAGSPAPQPQRPLSLAEVRWPGAHSSFLSMQVLPAMWDFSALTGRTRLPSPACLSSGVFEIAEASGVRTGTKIIIHLRADCREFTSEARVRGEQEPGPLGTCARVSAVPPATAF